VSGSPATEAAFELRIDSLAHGGDGVGRLPDGRVVFVPRTAPGDRIRAEITAKGKRELHARAVRVLEPGPARIAPVCPHYELCGGCQWQHVDLKAQLAAKEETLRETLVRVGRVPREEIPKVEVLASPEPLRYRRRARFHVGPSGRLGYVGHGGQRAVEIGSCHLLTPALEALALEVSRALQTGSLRSKVRTVEICEAGGRGALAIELDPSAGEANEDIAALLASVPRLTGAVVEMSGREWQVGSGVTLADGDGFIRPDTFAQANRAANRQLVAHALETLSPLAADGALELYCGDGNFTLPLSGKVARLLAADREGRALEILRRRAAIAGLKNLTVVAEDADRLLARLRHEGKRFEVALLDPPRTGAREIMDALAAVVARRIVYVSCDPATLSRDLGQLRTRDFRLAGLTMVDLFPQTYHLEAIAVLERSA
jgi:23S rRNA (uracil1939-C5)-methyltransferase